MFQQRKTGWLFSAVTVLFLCASCASQAQILAPEQPPTPTILATPVVHIDALPTDTLPVPEATAAPEVPTSIPPTAAPNVNIFGAALERIAPASGLTLMAQAGSVWTRRDYPWSMIEPTEGARNWGSAASLDAELLAAADSHMQVVLILGSSPDWAMDGNHPQCGGRIRQSTFGALANFARDLVARYSFPPFNVRYYELWNEPEVYSFLGCWGEPSDPLGYYGGFYYGEMLKVVYPAMKAANPDAQIMVGGLLLDAILSLKQLNSDGSPQDCSMTDFFTGILASGAGNAFDGVSFHAYDYYRGSLGKYKNENFGASWNTTGPAMLMKSKYLRDKMTAYGVTNKFLMNTEVALLCDGKSCQTAEFEATKAFYLVQAYAAALADGYIANIWYSVFGERNSGLLTRDLEPLPAFQSFQFVHTTLDGMRYTGRPNAGDGVSAYEFSNGNKTVFMLWAIDEQSHTFILTINPQKIYRIGMDGKANQEPPTTEIHVDTAPLFVILESNP